MVSTWRLGGMSFRTRTTMSFSLYTMLTPFSEVEFWAGHTSRLHDRFRYLVQPDGSWKVDRLAP